MQKAQKQFLDNCLQTFSLGSHGLQLSLRRFNLSYEHTLFHPEAGSIFRQIAGLGFTLVQVMKRTVSFLYDFGEGTGMDAKREKLSASDGMARFVFVVKGVGTGDENRL